MSRILDLHGYRFVRLMAIEVIKEKGKRTRWLCKCDCGNFKEVVTDYLRSGRTKSCGCLQKESRKSKDIKFKKHGKWESPEFRAWQGMWQRCDNPNNKNYKKYGARGIKVSKRWENFEQFYEDMGPRPSNEYSIDRIDNDEGYYPANCRWASRSTQMKNRTVSLSKEAYRIIELIMEKDNVSHSTAYKRLRRLAKCLLNN